MKKSVKVMAAAMAAMMALAGCGSKTAETTAADTKAAETTTQAAEESSADAAEAPEVAEGEYTVGIGQFAEHGSLDNCRTGFLQGLADEGIVEGKNLTVLYENAQADGGDRKPDHEQLYFQESRPDLCHCNPNRAECIQHSKRCRHPGYLYCSNGSGTGKACQCKMEPRLVGSPVPINFGK